MPRKAKTLTAKAIRALKPREQKYDVRDGAVPGLMIVVAPSGRKTWTLEYTRDNKRTRMSLQILADAQGYTPGRVKTEQERAWREALKHRAALTDKTYDPQQKNDAGDVPTLKKYLSDHYEPWALLHRTDGAATVARIRACFFEEFGKLPITKITAIKVEAWRDDRLGAGIQASTLNRDVGALRACLSHKGRRAFKRVKRWCPKHPFGDDLDLLEVITENPRFLDRDEGEDTRLFQALDDREQKLRRERASANEWRSVRGYDPLPELGTFADHLKPMVTVLLHTGLRIGELTKLEWKAVNLSAKKPTLTVLASTSKPKRSRTVPLNSVAQQALRDWRDQSWEIGLVFSPDGKTPMKSIRRSFGRVLEAAGIENFTCHHLRHTYASWLVQDGHSIYHVSHLLGHASVTTTEIYSHLATDHSREAVERLTGKGI